MRRRLGTGQHEDCLTLMVVDGLGHGTFAAAAAECAQQAFAEAPRNPRATCWNAPIAPWRHARCRRRGRRAVAVGSVSYAGVGNITAVWSARRNPRDWFRITGRLV